jgi:hypothetical protein
MATKKSLPKKSAKKVAARQNTKPAAKKAAPTTEPRKAATRKAGRPSNYSAQIADSICERLAAGESLRQICTDAKMPDRKTVDRWADQFPEFAARRARAREAQADGLFDEMADIENKTIAKALDPAIARVVLSSKQWRAAKLAPKVYGDKLALGQAHDLPPIPPPAAPASVSVSFEVSPCDAYKNMLVRQG